MREFDDAVLAELLGLLGVGHGDLDPAYPPRIAYSGNWHPVLVFADRTLFDSFAFDPDAVRHVMDVQGWAATVTVLHRIVDGEFGARNLFTVDIPAAGGIVVSGTAVRTGDVVVMDEFVGRRRGNARQSTQRAARQRII